MRIEITELPELCGKLLDIVRAQNVLESVAGLEKVVTVLRVVAPNGSTVADVSRDDLVKIIQGRIDDLFGEVEAHYGLNFVPATTHAFEGDHLS